jgi:hypothetical protein
MLLPTWNGQQPDPADLPNLLHESFDVLSTAIGGPSVHRLSEAELLHIVEAASLLATMIEWTHSTVVPAVRAHGASWARLAAAMGVTRSTVQYRYEKAAKEWSARDQAPDEG